MIERYPGGLMEELPIEVFYVKNGEKEIWDRFYKNEDTRDQFFYDRMTDQIKGTADAKWSKIPFATDEDYERIYDEKFKNSKQGGIFEKIVELKTTLKWIIHKFGPEVDKFLDFEDKNGRVWDAKSLSRWTGEKRDINRELRGMQKLFNGIVKSSKEKAGKKIERWILGIFDHNYELTKVMIFDFNGILNYLDKEISKLESDIPL